jgi:hypothetical protein
MCDLYIETTTSIIQKYKDLNLKIAHDTKIVTENNKNIQALAESLGDSDSIELDALRKQVASLHAINNEQLNEFGELRMELMKARAQCKEFMNLAHRIDDATITNSKTTPTPIDVLSLLPRDAI